MTIAQNAPATVGMGSRGIGSGHSDTNFVGCRNAADHGAGMVTDSDTGAPDAHSNTNSVNRNRGMGGGQALNIGLIYLDYFARICGFSSAPNLKQGHDLITNPEDEVKKSNCNVYPVEIKTV